MNRIRPSNWWRLFCIVFLLILLTSFWTQALVSAETSPRTIYVDAYNAADPYEDGSHDHPFDRIQEGVDFASVGDTVVVASGVYREEVVIGRNKSGISLMGEEGAVIDGEGRRSGIRVGIGLSRPDYIDNVTIVGFTVQNCVKGITLMRCRYAFLRNNTMVGNLYNFADYSLVVNDVDASNTVDGKPIYYWVNKKDREVPLDAGYVALINSRNIVVKDLNLTNNGQGLLLKNTTFSRIENVSVVHNQDGIYLDLESRNNTIVGNTISDNSVISIYLSTSSGNIISNNTISNSDYGAYLTTSYGLNTTNNVIVDNIIQGHWKGVVLRGGHASNPVTDNIIKNNLFSNNGFAISMRLSAFNLIYHNNFVKNTIQVESYESENVFDYFGEGNYWDHYVGVDANNDGMGDTFYEIDEANRDNYPLMGFFKSFNVFWEERAYTLDTISSSTISDFIFSQPEKSIIFDVLTEGKETGFCRVTVPTVLLGGPYNVLVAGSLATTLLEETNGTHTFLFFTYTGDGVRVEIFGSEVIAEFHHFLFPALMLTTSLVVLLQRKSLLKMRR
jgi:parallel beta-helix repeat protein